VYGIDGEGELEEQTLDHLNGYDGARPVRIGNAAYKQDQHDVWGSVIESVYLHATSRDHLDARLWPILKRQVEQALEHWREPDFGIWEVRGEPKHFTSSKLMCWVAADRGARLAEIREDREMALRWQAAADEIRDDICAHALDERGVFCQHYGTTALDASVLLILAYGMGLLFSLKTHREVFGGAEHAETGEAPWPLNLALATLAGVTVLVGLASEIFVESVQQAAVSFDMTPAFVGFIIVALVGGAAEMASALSAARQNRLDLSVSIALGSAAQIALFVAPILVLLSYVIGPTPMNLQFWPGAVIMVLISTLTAFLLASSGRSAWFVGMLVLMVYLIFAMTLYLMPPRFQ